jgi:microcompartment protein CcmK/EutM
MAAVIQLKRSSSAGVAPATSDLALGELAVNTYDGRVYLEKNDGSASIVEVGSNPATFSVNSAYTFPTSDGAANQVLVTDGSGALSFADQSGTGDGVTTFTYSISSTTTSITGNDDNANSLSYTAGEESVYLNGVKLVGGGVDYTTTDSSTITLTSSALNGDVVEVVAIESLDLVQGYFTTTALTTTTADQVISSVSKSTYKGVKYVIVAKHGSAGNHATEVLVTHDGTTVYMSEYATVFSGSSLFSVDADISSDNLRLLVTPSNTNTTFRTFQIRLS